ncbi:aromatic prenyltransferase [Streptomyces sp. NPDC020412]|uniref:aromatic prenyltransferase n=1 Tax=Streptomyces sp. NPDC020412 TaxID=3365073 RepID=UPI00379F096B
MSQVTEVEDVYSVIEESARQVGVPCTREKIVPVLTAYKDGLADAGIVLSVSTGEHPTSELDYTITVPTEGPDPYTTAVEHGFVEATDHPAATLLSDIRKQVPVSEYFIDGGVAAGFSKIYAHFPFDPLMVEQLAALPSMPHAVAENAGLFARHHLHQAAMIGIDYRRRTVNLYFAGLPAEFGEAENVLSLQRELGLPRPEGELLGFARKSFRVYVTLSWDSAQVKRICYAPAPVRGWDPSALPVQIQPETEKFVRSARRTYGGDPIVIAACKWTADGPYLNLGPYIRVSPLMRTLLRNLTGQEV